MQASTNHQKQKLTLIKSRRLASSIIRQYITLSSNHKKRFSVIGLGIVTGIGVPAIVFASQQAVPPERKSQSNSQSQSATVNIKSTTSSSTEEVFSSPAPSALEAVPTEQSPGQPAAQNATVTINGEPVPLTNGSVSEQVPDGAGGQLDVNVSIGGESSSNSSHTYTDISIDSSTTQSDDNSTRGSPRR